MNTRFISTFLSLFVLQGCYHWRAEPTPLTPKLVGNPSAVIRITTRSGAQSMMRGLSQTADSLVGQRVFDPQSKPNPPSVGLSQRIAFSINDVETAEVYRLNPTRTLVALTASLGAAALIVAYIVVGSGLAGLAAAP